MKCLKRLPENNREVEKSPHVVRVVPNYSDEPEFLITMDQCFSACDRDILKDLTSKFKISGVTDDNVKEYDQVWGILDAHKKSVRLARKHSLSENLALVDRLLEEEMIKRCEKAWKPFLFYAKPIDTNLATAMILNAVDSIWRGVANELSHAVSRLQIEVRRKKVGADKIMMGL